MEHSTQLELSQLSKFSKIIRETGSFDGSYLSIFYDSKPAHHLVVKVDLINSVFPEESKFRHFSATNGLEYVYRLIGLFYILPALRTNLSSEKLK